MLITASDGSGHWRDLLATSEAKAVWVFPYLGLTETLEEQS
jgi:hypothetical protein